MRWLSMEIRHPVADRNSCSVISCAAYPYKYLNRGAGMRNRFCKSHETSKELAKATVAPLDVGASRRKFLQALAAAGASTILPASGLLGQSTLGGSRVTPNRIDVHHHLFPPFYIAAVPDE